MNYVLLLNIVLLCASTPAFSFPFFHDPFDREIERSFRVADREMHKLQRDMERHAARIEQTVHFSGGDRAEDQSHHVQVHFDKNSEILKVQLPFAIEPDDVKTLLLDNGASLITIKENGFVLNINIFSNGYSVNMHNTVAEHKNSEHVQATASSQVTMQRSQILGYDIDLDQINILIAEDGTTLDIALPQKLSAIQHHIPVNKASAAAPSSNAHEEKDAIETK